ncbi:GFA family protein [Bradyrhizobium manausense]|uniref:GFA family protein n=1 Tax=Bradyrhizobium manausense TaxID=989370 RepID=UPI001BA8B306|nr:GFA family protein [Bradyrhizobium manausense]MBR0834524.1 GFA family protein [Bradyrhizobium manausense]
MTKVRENALTVPSGEDPLSVYKWNTHRAKHLFCSRCGIYTFHRERAVPDQSGVNVFCLENFDPASVPMRATEGIEMSVVDPNARCQWAGPQEAG